MSTPPYPPPIVASSPAAISSPAPTPTAASASASAPNPPATATAAPAAGGKGHEREPSNPPSAKRIKVDHATSSQPSTPRPVVSTPTDSGPTAMASSTVKGGSDQPPKAGAGAQPGGSTAKAPAGAAASAQGASETKENFDSLVDIMGASGVDLRAEEEAIQQRDLLDHSTTNAAEAQHDQDGELYLQVYPLAFKVHTIAQKHGLGVDAAVLNYLSLAARTRFRNMLEAMIASSRHRSWSSHQHPPPLYEGDERRPMYHEAIVSDPRKQLALLEKAERGEEARRRRERLARDEEAAALASGGSGAAGEGGGDGEGVEVGPDGVATPRSGVGADGKRKAKKIGPGVAARNMSEDVQKRLANSTAMRNLGGSASKYSWLQGGGAFGSGASPAAASPLAGKSRLKGELGGDGDGEGGTSTPSRLPKPKFAPQPSINWKGGGLGSKLSGGGSGGLGDGGGDEGAGGSDKAKGAAGAGAWGDVAARQAAKEEEERQERLRVTLRDALFALEYERGGATGYGSGEAILYRARAKASRAA